MKIKGIRWVLLVSILLFLILGAGCWDRRELNEIAIITAAGIDPGPNNTLSFVYQIVNPSAVTVRGANVMKLPYYTWETTGQSLYAASKKANREVSRELYFGHLQAFVINSEYAKKKGIKDILDVLYRNNELREDINLLITKDQTASMVLSSQVTLEGINGIAIKKHLDNTYKNIGNVRPVELREVINTLSNRTFGLVLPNIQIVLPKEKSNTSGDQNAMQKSVIIVEGYSIFKGDKMVGTLDTRMSRGLNFVTDNIEKTELLVPYGGDINSLEIYESNTDITTFVEAGRPRVLIEIKNDANISEVRTPIDLTNLEVIEGLETSANKTLEKNIRKLIEMVQEKYKIDIFRFGEAFSKQHPDEWKELEKDWEEYFVDLEVDIKVNTTIREIGMNNKTFQIKMDGAKK